MVVVHAAVDHLHLAQVVHRDQLELYHVLVQLQHQHHHHQLICSVLIT